MKRAIQLAQQSLGKTYPNPMVGSVIVHNGNIIGEGWHQKAGEPHAEVNAIHSVKDKTLLKQSTIYVSLEPCSHYGKTPPCADYIIQHQIPNVVIGTIDPFGKVKGRGISKLKDVGCNVITNVLQKECQWLNRRFFTFYIKKRAYIILKWAQTTNGLIAPNTKDKQQPVWITNSHSQQLVHKWRSEEQAILVGSATARVDNPSLTTRHWYGNNPTRLVIDKQKKLPKTLNLFSEHAKTIIFSEANSDLTKMPESVGKYCFENNLQSLIVEGGANVLQQFIDANLWDEARVFTGPSIFFDGVKAPSFCGNLQNTTTINDDTLRIYTND